MRDVADATGASRLVYGGRDAAELGAGVLGDWDLDPVALSRRLRGCREVALLDPLSFPLEALEGSLGDWLLAVRIPGSLPLDVLVPVLGPPLLASVTLHDRVIVTDDQRWRDLAGRFGWAAQQRITPDGEGAAPAYAALRSAWRREAVVHVDTPYGHFAAHAEDLITAQLQEFGAHHRSGLAALRSLTRPGDHVVDVGAHIGTFAVPLADRVGPSGRVTAFEPAPASLALLRENLELNHLGDRVDVHQAVVAGGAGSSYQGIAPPANTGGTAYRADEAPGDGSVRGTSLDDWWTGAGRPGVDVVKVDVEGMELAVLRGAEQLLTSEQPVLMVEVERGQLRRRNAAVGVLQRLLVERDYRLFHNPVERNRDDDHFRLEPAGNLREHGDLLDVFAVPGDSRRLPAPPGSSS